MLRPYKHGLDERYNQGVENSANHSNPCDPSAQVIYRHQISIKRILLWFSIGIVLTTAVSIAAFPMTDMGRFTGMPLLMIIAVLIFSLLYAFDIVVVDAKFRSIVFQSDQIVLSSLWLNRQRSIKRNEILSIGAPPIMTALLWIEQSSRKRLVFHWKPFQCAQMPGKRLSDFAVEWFSQT